MLGLHFMLTLSNKNNSVIGTVEVFKKIKNKTNNGLN